MASDLKPILLLKDKEISEITVSFVVQISAIMLLGACKTIWIVIVSTLVVGFALKKSFYKTVFNSGVCALSLLISGNLFKLLKMSPENVTLDIIPDMPAIIVAATSYLLLKTFFISVVVSLSSGNRFVSVFFSDFNTLTYYFCTLTPISMVITILHDPNRPYIILIMVPPVIMADQALRRYYSLHRETQETLRVLADIIDERDKYTYNHSIRVANYTRKIAEALKLPLDVINEIEIAARVHDLGKINIDDSVLRKNGKLTDEEYEKIKKHPEVAYRVLKNLKNYKNVAKYVLYHHVHMDGGGYPKRKTNIPLPLGARILAVADSYDAMTTDRPYRKALSQHSAVEELKRCSGAQFDPRVVNAFINVLKEEYDYEEQEQEIDESKYRKNTFLIKEN
ncbi:MAG TPA: HD-GYP domain-containing protein [Clostridiaceae bacterium]|nr:HD-GYP domain-containing protein [Clostridiaceae bacterium]